MRVMITGGCGFVGHHVVEHFLKNTDWTVVVLDRLDYASMGFDRLRDISVFDSARVEVRTHDLNLPITHGLRQEIGPVDFIVHMAAGSHVDRSIDEPVSFIKNNVNNTLNMLEYARTLPSLKKFIYFSTDEVYGTAPDGRNYQEGDRFNPGNPYSASKAAAECFCMAYRNTYRMPIMITNTMNIIGERQHHEKFLPKIIRSTLLGETLPIHGNSDRTKAGSRFYLHARNAADAVLFILQNVDEFLDNIDASKGKFNIVGERETDNLEFAQMVAKHVGKPLHYDIVDFHSSRPGHDLRYALDNTKLLALGWSYPKTLEESIQSTVEWHFRPGKLSWLNLTEDQIR